MGGAVGKVIQGVFDDNKITDAGVKEQVEERVNHLNEITKMKIDHFYNNVVLQATGKGSNIEVPICKVVDKLESLYAADSETITNTLLATIEGVVGDLLGGNWKSAIADLVKGGLESFFGPTTIASSGITTETCTYNVVWSYNAMIRLDTFVTKSVLSHMAGLNKSKQIFGGYVMVASVIDLSGMNKGVIMYEFSKFYNNSLRGDPKAVEGFLKEISGMEDVMKAISSLYELRLGFATQVPVPVDSTDSPESHNSQGGDKAHKAPQEQ